MKHCSLFFAALVFSTPVSALTISEPPDLASRIANNTSVGTLDLGINVASGTLDATCVDPGVDFQCNRNSSIDPQDGFLFTISAGEQLTSVEVAITGSGPSGFILSAQLFRPENTSDNLDYTEQALGQTQTLNDFAPLGAGEYSFTINGWYAAEAGDWNASWTARFAVEEAPEPVPLPASAVLLLTCFGGLQLLRRKGRAASLTDI